MAQGEVSIRVYLLPESKDKFKTACFLKGLNMSDVTAELIEEWLAKNAVELPTSKPADQRLPQTHSDRSQPQPPTASKTNGKGRGKSKHPQPTKPETLP